MNKAGHLLDEHANVVRADGVRDFLATNLRVYSAVTDIFVFVHGWRTPERSAQQSFARFFGALANSVHRWPYLGDGATPFVPWFIGVQWPSCSPPTPGGYKTIRDRAHAMSVEGHASFVLGQLLGYLDAERAVPDRGPDRLRTSSGQYLHCIGHSFGGRFLGEAICWAADRRPATLSWRHRSRRPFGVDTYLAFQMAAQPDIFWTQFAGITTDGPVHGPIVLTYSKHDYANAVWHRVMESVPGIGAVGSAGPPEDMSTVALHPPGVPYQRDEFATPVVNVDASAVFTRPRLSVTGAHSDYWRLDSIHLLLSLAAFAR